jgi:hypothetical protein
VRITRDAEFERAGDRACRDDFEHLPLVCARGMSTCDIEAHLLGLYASEPIVGDRHRDGGQIDERILRAGPMMDFLLAFRGSAIRMSRVCLLLLA